MFATVLFGLRGIELLPMTIWSCSFLQLTPHSWPATLGSSMPMSGGRRCPHIEFLDVLRLRFNFQSFPSFPIHRDKLDDELNRAIPTDLKDLVTIC